MTLLRRFLNRLFQWRSDGTGPIHLKQRRIFILPTRAGLLFALTLIVMLIAAINYNLALGHALVFLLVGLGMSAMIHTFRNLHGLRITPGRSTPIFAGSSAPFTLHLENTSAEARRSLAFFLDRTLITRADCAPGQIIEVTLGIPTTRRGWFELPRIRIATRYPLGLFQAWGYLQPAMRCLVYPSPIDSPLPPPDTTARPGESRGDAAQEDFAGFRVRQPADSPRHIAWKASTRTPEHAPWLVKQFAGGGQAELALDWALTAQYPDPETRLSILCGWVLAADASQLDYRLLLPGTPGAVGQGANHLSDCLEALACYVP